MAPTTRILGILVGIGAGACGASVQNDQLAECVTSFDCPEDSTCEKGACSSSGGCGDSIDATTMLFTLPPRHDRFFLPHLVMDGPTPLLLPRGCPGEDTTTDVASLDGTIASLTHDPGCFSCQNGRGFHICVLHDAGGRLSIWLNPALALGGDLPPAQLTITASAAGISSYSDPNRFLVILDDTLTDVSLSSGELTPLVVLEGRSIFVVPGQDGSAGSAVSYESAAGQATYEIAPLQPGAVFDESFVTNAPNAMVPGALLRRPSPGYLVHDGVPDEEVGEVAVYLINHGQASLAGVLSSRATADGLARRYELERSPLPASGAEVLACESSSCRLEQIDLGTAAVSPGASLPMRDAYTQSVVAERWNSCGAVDALIGSTNDESLETTIDYVRLGP